MSSPITGRHRAPNRLSTAFNPSLENSRSGVPPSKAFAVILISGAMVASLALPASAAPATKVKAAPPVTVAVTVATAPTAAQAPLVPRTFGQIGFTGVVKPKPAAPVVSSRTVVAVSRSTTRTAISPTTTAAPILPAATRTPISPTATRTAISRSTARTAISPTTTPTRARPVSAPVQTPGTGGVLSIAASLTGIYYVYGGTTPAGFDCSGFTQYVFNKVGIKLPRTAEQQRQATTPVTNPRPGDLVFFGIPAYHNGIYAGNGKMYDSPKTGSVTALRAIWSATVTYGRP